MENAVGRLPFRGIRRPFPSRYRLPRALCSKAEVNFEQKAIPFISTAIPFIRILIISFFRIARFAFSDFYFTRFIALSSSKCLFQPLY
jgi:hypothetical protein